MILILACGGTAARGSTLGLTLTYTGSIDADFNDIGTPLEDVNPVVDPTDYHRFDVYLELFDAAPNENFQLVLFDVVLGPGFTPADFGAWTPNVPLYDPPGPPLLAPIYSGRIRTICRELPC